ncbi:MAG: hypothetical protein AB7Q29_07295 [Vicinamibacterales bacterium]
MTSAVRAAAAGLLLVVGTTAHAQVMSGTAQVDVIGSGTRTRGMDSRDNMVAQTYTFNWASPLIDERLVRYDLGTSFSTFRQRATRPDRADQTGRAGNLGYQLGAQLLSASPFPLTVRLSRLRTTSLGDLGLTNPIRNGLISASGAPPSDYEAINHDMMLNWHVGLGRLPTVDLSYRRNSSDMSGGNIAASQQARNLTTAVSKSSPRTHYTLRYQSSHAENHLDQTYTQRLGTLDYAFGATLTKHSRLNVTAGRRSAFSRVLFQVPSDTATGAYAPPVDPGGGGSGLYGQVGYHYDPGSRFTLRATATVDAQEGTTARTSSALGSVTSQVEAVKGLHLTAGITSGRRQQIVRATLASVLTQRADVGAAYQRNYRHLGIGGSLGSGMGAGTSAEGIRGGSRSWSADGHASTSVRWLGGSIGYGRSHYRDDLLDFGNYASRQLRASLQAEGRRGNLVASAMRTLVTRGRELTYSRNVQRSISATASWRAGRRNQLSATVGHFDNDIEQFALAGTDRSVFWGLGIDGSPTQTLHFSAWARHENAATTITRYRQNALTALARVDYRVRTLKFVLEYRKSRSEMFYPGLLSSTPFTGHQLRFSVARLFGMRLS